MTPLSTSEGPEPGIVQSLDCSDVAIKAFAGDRVPRDPPSGAPALDVDLDGGEPGSVPSPHPASAVPSTMWQKPSKSSGFPDAQGLQAGPAS